VIAESQPGLERVMATVPGVSAVATWGEVPGGVTRVVPMLSLPHVLGTALADVPREVPYVFVPPNTDAPQLTEPGFKVGLAWRGNPHHENDRHRSLTLETLAPLSEVAGVAWYSLQVGPGQADSREVWKTRLQPLHRHLTDFAVTAAVIAQLDLVITVDSVVAHLAGAMGKPVWCVLSRGNDWRWGESGGESLWYPTMRLFRQHYPRNWAPTMAAMTKALGDAVQAGRG
jgi:hypothetical protein